MWKTVVKWCILTALLAYIIGASIWARAQAGKKVCTGINVEIVSKNTADSISKQGVVSELHTYPRQIVGQQLHSINTRTIESFLRAIPQYEDVECTLTSRGELNVRVQPMIPVMRVFDGKESYYINKDGKKMQSKASYYNDVPVASGQFTDSFPASHLLPVSKFVSSDPTLNKLVSMIYATDPNNIYLIPRIHGHVVNLGDTTRLGEKRDALLAMYRKVMPYRGWEYYDTISVKFKGQVVAVKRDKSLPVKQFDDFDEIEIEEASLPDPDLKNEP